MSIPYFEPSVGRGELLEAIRAEGCAVIVNKLLLADTQRFADDLRLALKAAPFAEGVFLGQSTKRLGGLLSRSSIAQKIAEDGQILALMEGVLGTNCDRIQINLTQATAIYPFQDAQYIHRDEGLFAHCTIAGEKMVNVMWALTDFTTDNGATLVVPGSNHWDKERVPTQDEIRQAEMPPGSVLIWLGSTLHAAGANNTSAVRLGAIVSYSLGWLRQGENQFLTYPPEVAKQFPETLRRLIGYSVHRPNVGLVDNDDPIWLTREEPRQAGSARDHLTEELEALLADT